MGFTSNGVVGLKAVALADRVKAMQETMGDTALSAQQKSSKLLDEHTFATVIAGCHVKWATTTVLNKGYIMEASWDSSVDRRAGGYDNGAAPSAQEFTFSNMSSYDGVAHEGRVPLQARVIVVAIDQRLQHN